MARPRKALPPEGASYQVDDEQVDRPSHYQSLDGSTVECIDAIRAALGPEGFICWLRGEIFKYTWRLGRKGGPIVDAGKLAWYSARLRRELED